MKILTEYVLKRPITTIMAILCLIVFGYSSVTGSKIELTPDMDMSMMIIMTTYEGANPEDVDELVTKEIEDSVSTLDGLDSITSTSSEGSSMIMPEYEYGTDMDEAYDDLKQQPDIIEMRLPDEAETPTVLQMNSNSQADMTLAVNNPSQDDLYNYVNDTIVPELEKVSEAAEVTAMGGSEKYIKIEIIPEKLEQYGVTMTSIASADEQIPAGDTDVGNQSYSVSTRAEFDTMESLTDIPLTTSGNDTVYLEDVAYIYMNSDEGSSIAGYNGEDMMLISISKQQSNTSIELSNAVKEVIESLKASDSDLSIEIVNDNADSIIDSLKSVIETLILAIIISMTIIWLFFGDIKASLMVGSSIPVSILVALILMNLMGFSLNVITLSALTLGVGMMVDNSSVVIDSCFRATESNPENKDGLVNYAADALNGTGIVSASILGGTLTTCVVFLPLAFLEGMTGQLFEALGFTIVFCLSASLLSAITVVPLCYLFYKPKENKKAPLSKPVERMQESYKK